VKLGVEPEAVADEVVLNLKTAKAIEIEAAIASAI